MLDFRDKHPNHMRMLITINLGLQYLLSQRSANFSYKGPDIKYFCALCARLFSVAGTQLHNFNIKVDNM